MENETQKEIATRTVEKLTADLQDAKAVQKEVMANIAAYIEGRRPKKNWPFRHPQKGLHY